MNSNINDTITRHDSNNRIESYKRLDFDPVEFERNTRKPNQHTLPQPPKHKVIEDFGSRIVVEDLKDMAPFHKQLGYRHEIMFLNNFGKSQQDMMQLILDQGDWTDSGTFTFEFGIQTMSPERKEEAALKAIDHFERVVNQKKFGNKHRRYGVRLNILYVIEHVGSNIHIHFVAELPEGTLVLKNKVLPLNLGLVWRSLDHTGIHSEVRKIYHLLGWVWYITKEKNLSNMVVLNKN